MDDKIKDAIKSSLKELDKLEDRLENWVDDLPDDTDELRATMKSTMKKIHAKLTDSVGHGGKLSDEAELQAHLGLMEAKDKMEASREIMDNYLESATEQSKTLMSQVELKAKLAQMEAEDFWQERGPKLQEEFKQSGDTMLKLAETTADEIQKQLGKWNELIGKRK